MACRAGSDKAALVRVVRATDGAIRVDPTGRLPGRGAYVCATAECAAKALKQKRFDRALRAQAPPELAEELEGVVRKLGDNLT